MISHHIIIKETLVWPSDFNETLLAPACFHNHCTLYINPCVPATLTSIRSGLPDSTNYLGRIAHRVLIWNSLYGQNDNQPNRCNIINGVLLTVDKKHNYGLRYLYKPCWNKNFINWFRYYGGNRSFITMNISKFMPITHLVNKFAMFIRESFFLKNLAIGNGRV